MGLGSELNDCSSVSIKGCFFYYEEIEENV